MRSLHSIVADDWQQLRKDLEELLTHSKLERRFAGRIAGLPVITPNPYYWLPLPSEARAIQVRIRDRYYRFAGIVRALLADAPETTRAKLTESEKKFLFAVDQTEPSAHENPRAAGGAALLALEGQFRYVDQLHSIAADPILLPDTRAFLIFV